jgi:hypothetical protein
MTETSVERVIDEMTFRIGKLPGRSALRMLHKVTGAIFPAIGLAAGQLGADLGNLGKMDVTKLLKAIGGGALPRLFEDLPVETLMELVDGLFASVVVIKDAKAVSVGGPAFDLVFQGKTKTVLKLLVACVEVNFSDFFGEGGLAGLVARAQTSLAATKASAGTSSGAGLSGE